MIVSVINQKGGSGKTATSISLASYFAHKGHKTLLVDLDQQRNSSRILLEEYTKIEEMDSAAAFFVENPPPLPTRPTTEVPNLYITPSHLGLSVGDVKLFGILEREYNLGVALKPIEHSYELIVLDCPPSLGLIAINALAASNYAIITTDPSIDGLDGSKLVMQNIKKIQKKVNPGLRVAGVLLAMAEPTVLTREIGEKLREEYGDLFFDTQIPRNVRLGEAHGSRKDIFSYAPQSKAAEAYQKLIETELLPIITTDHE